MNLFTPPEPRPAPERLRVRPLAEVEPDVLDGRDEDDHRGRTRRWLVPMVAAGLLAALAGGAALMNGIGHHVLGSLGDASADEARGVVMGVLVGGEESLAVVRRDSHTLYLSSRGWLCRTFLRRSRRGGAA